MSNKTKPFLEIKKIITPGEKEITPVNFNLSISIKYCISSFFNRIFKGSPLERKKTRNLDLKMPFVDSKERKEYSYRFPMIFKIVEEEINRGNLEIKKIKTYHSPIVVDIIKNIIEEGNNDLKILKHELKKEVEKEQGKLQAELDSLVKEKDN